MDLLSTKTQAINALTAMSVAAAAMGDYGYWAGAKARLTKAAVTEDVDRVLADYSANECDFSGYAAKTITWLAPSISDDGSVELIGTIPEFRHNGGGIANTAHNLYITDSAGAVLLGHGALDSLAPFAVGTDSAVFTVRMRLKIDGLAVEVS